MRIGMKRLALSTLLAASLGLHAAPVIQRKDGETKATGSKTYLLVVAHPDDEIMVGPMLAKLARQGHRVHVLIATDGKYGTRVTTIPEGDVLGRVRRKESECACERLGVSPPIFLSIDRLDTKNGVRPYLNGRKRLLLELERQLTTLKPDAIFTFGPDGEYGHSEHIVVGAAITEVLLREGLVEKFPLYYLSWLEHMVQDDDELSYVDPRYVDLTVTYTDADEKLAIEAGRCHVSQFTPEEMETQARGMSADKSNSIPFRRLHVRDATRTQALDEF